MSRALGDSKIRPPPSEPPIAALAPPVAIHLPDAGCRQSLNTGNRSCTPDRALQGEKLGQTRRISTARHDGIGEQGEDLAGKHDLAVTSPKVDREAREAIGDQGQAMILAIVDRGTEEPVGLSQAVERAALGQSQNAAGEVVLRTWQSRLTKRHGGERGALGDARIRLVNMHRAAERASRGSRRVQRQTLNALRHGAQIDGRLGIGSVMPEEAYHRLARQRHDIATRADDDAIAVTLELLASDVSNQPPAPPIPAGKADARTMARQGLRSPL